ncbi:diaminopimelate decarboxylase family protein [Streptomyces narbonensis]|uniref:diaminopimelate decarboxylase family protein n=1 Tax=Streptomyces narbonensis TaxID=67333 RepID=UPI001679B3C7|nr:hypothetical protein [Streptomyces narbonensis]GGW11628.1 hypothetical protein GCM10010230_65420 [Streptomyces narbonensis]
MTILPPPTVPTDTVPVTPPGPGPADLRPLWPATTTERPRGEVHVGGVPLTEIAESHGTPVYVLDEAEVRERCRTYRVAFPEAGIHYAAKAFLCRALARWVEEEGLGLDVCSAGELELAVTTGFPADRILLHGNAKSRRGPAGIAVYRVLAVKRTPGRAYVAVDGGMSDNPRPALYGVRYAPRLIGRHSRAGAERVTVVGRHCEAGDILAEDVPLPADTHPGDLLAVPVAGAYHLAMASSYNLVGRPPVVAVLDGRARVLVRRETLEDLRVRDVGL